MRNRTAPSLLTLAVAACVLAAPAWGKLDKPIQIALSEVKDLDEKSWEAAGKVDDKACRVLKAGKRGKIPIKAWWDANSLRPEKGASFLAEVVFKDVATAPIRVDLFAGLPGSKEIHRIGGLADGKWKSALVPVPWDMIMRIPKKDITEIQFSAPKGEAGIPFASIEIRDGDPVKDEARWCEETRAWVARVQSESRLKAKKPAPSDSANAPNIPDAMKTNKIVPFVRRYVHLIYDNHVPKEGEAGAALKLRLASNEIEPGQFAVYANGADLKNVRISIPDGLKDGQGKKLKAELKLFTAEFSVVKSGKLFPQRLWPTYPVDIPKGFSHLFWLTVETKGEGVAAGTYKGEIKIEADGVPTGKVDVEATVLPIKLLTLTEAGLYMGSCTTGLLPAHEMEILNQHNHNSINLWYYGFAPGIIKKSKTEFDLDFTICDEYMKHARAAGTQNFVYFLGGNPYGYPDTLHIERELYRRVFHDNDDLMEGRLDLLRKTMKAPGKVHPDVRPLYVQWAKKFMAHAKEKNWPEPILTPFDEPAKWVQGNWARAKVYYWEDKKTGRHGVDKIKKRDMKKFEKKMADLGVKPEYLGDGGADKWIKGHFKDACAAIHEGWPKARIYGSIHHAKPGLPFLPDIEVFCTNAIGEDHKLGDKVRAGGPTKVFWQYAGTGDSTPTARPRYNFGFFFGAFDSRGSLCWAYNWGKRFDTRSGHNWLYAWTTPYSVVRAPFWEGMREAWDDRRYIETLKKTADKAGKRKEIDAMLDEIFNTAVKSRTAGGRDRVNDFWARTKDPDALDTMRDRIAKKIMELGQ